MPTIAPASRKTSRHRIRIGPEDNGRRMSLAEFSRAVGREGWLYELAKGVIEVTDVPKLDHLAQVTAIRNQFIVFQEAHPGAIHTVAGSHDCKILLEDDQSERHPDLSIYIASPPDVKDIWSVWVPAIVIEVVSERSGKRDYEEKPAEYLDFGVMEYLIVDGSKRQMTVLERWRGHWRPRVVRADQKYTTRLLPKFSLDLKRVFGSR
jgi:Uma2 family endonuclease